MQCGRAIIPLETVVSFASYVFNISSDLNSRLHVASIIEAHAYVWSSYHNKISWRQRMPWRDRNTIATFADLLGVTCRREATD